MGCDISLGSGQSNSVCSIFDVDLREKVGCWSDSNTLPENFTEQVYAMGQWVGGVSGMPLLNFEANGIGQVFGKRIKELGYSFIYKTTSEKKGFHEKKTTICWFSNPNTKVELLAGYNASLTACFHKNMSAKKFINHDEESIHEAETYIFEGRKLIPSILCGDTGGAEATHGDRTIADALCCLAAQDQQLAEQRFEEAITGTIAWRKKRQKEQERNSKNQTKFWLSF
jgi:hypothetical protein